MNSTPFFRGFGMLALALLCASHTTRAASANWNKMPVDGNWYNPANWTPTTVPNGPADLATFGSTSVYFITLPTGTDTVLDGLIYAAGAPQLFTIVSTGASLTFVGRGALNSTGAYSQLWGEAGSVITFQGSSTAGVFMANSGQTYFQDQSALTNGITCYGGDSSDLPGSVLVFSDQSQAINASFTVNGGGTQDTASHIYFNDDSTAMGCSFELSSDSVLDISGHNPPGVSVSAVGGPLPPHSPAGYVYLGANNLTVESGSFLSGEGAIQDGGASGGSGGSLTKVNDGVLTLGLPNTYTGGTTVTGGTLVVSNESGSGTGTGDVQVTAGTLGGSGTISGAVTIGSGSGTGAILAPLANSNKPATLTILSALTFNRGGIYEPALVAKPGHDPLADQVVANGVIIAKGVKFALRAVIKTTLSPGTTFTLISNTSATPISGTFARLPDGGTVTSGGITFQANYEGGDGNDLTLTVAP